MKSCGQPGQLWRVSHPAHRHYDYDDEIGYYSVVKVQGGRFFVIKMVDFSIVSLLGVVSISKGW
jgi:hypothetical protein